MITFNKKDHGFALFAVLLSILVLATVAGGITVAGSNHLTMSYSQGQAQTAHYAARTGAWMKLAQVRDGNLDPLAPTTMPATGATFSATVTIGDDNPDTFPPQGTYYIEGVGKTVSGHSKRVGVLASVTQSRWSNAAFGNSEVIMMAGSYTDSFNSDGGAVDHSLASIATNNPNAGIKLNSKKDIVIGWSGAVAKTADPNGKQKYAKHARGVVTPIPEASIQGPPGSSESSVVQAKTIKTSIIESLNRVDAKPLYRSFETAPGVVTNNPVTIPTLDEAPPTDSGTVAISALEEDARGGFVGDAKIDTTLGDLGVSLPAGITEVNSGLNGLASVTVSSEATTRLPPGSYDFLTVQNGGDAVLDVSDAEPGSEVSYVFSGIHLENGTLRVAQPPSGDVTVKVYVDTEDGSDPNRSVRMQGSSLLNPKTKPILLQFLIAGTGENILEGYDEDKDGVDSTPEAYYVAYAPEGTIKVNRGAIFGSVSADRVILEGDEGSLTRDDINPAVIHFDTTLLQDTGNPPTLKVMSLRYY